MAQISPISGRRAPRASPAPYRVGEHFGAAVLADIFAIVADQAVALAGDAMRHLAGGGELEALLDPLLVFNLGIFVSLPPVGDVRTATAALLAGRFDSSKAWKEGRL